MFYLRVELSCVKIYIEIYGVNLKIMASLIKIYDGIFVRISIYLHIREINIIEKL